MYLPYSHPSCIMPSLNRSAALLVLRPAQCFSPVKQRVCFKPTLGAAYTCAGAVRQQQLVYSLYDAEQHDKPGHPETASRIAAIDQCLQPYIHGNPEVARVSGFNISQEQVMQSLQLVHPAGYLQRVQEICSALQEPAMVDDSTYIAPGTFAACCETAAAVLAVLDAVLAGSAAGTAPAGFCIVRPPGHHVLPSRPMGFGLMNFIAVAARHAQHQQLVPINKVLIVDFDVHHGNGTEEIMYNDASVLYISTHQQGLWPYTGKLPQTGSGKGKGCTINIPLPGGTGHTAMAAVVEQIIRPAAHRFKPDLILISAELAHELCAGRCMFILEGGYHQESLAEAVLDSFAGILGLPALSRNTANLHAEPLAKVESIIEQARELHQL